MEVLLTEVNSNIVNSFWLLLDIIGIVLLFVFWVKEKNLTWENSAPERTLWYIFRKIMQYLWLFLILIWFLIQIISNFI